jgi:hypothetical protein
MPETESVKIEFVRMYQPCVPGGSILTTTDYEFQVGQKRAVMRVGSTFNWDPYRSDPSATRPTRSNDPKALLSPETMIKIATSLVEIRLAGDEELPEMLNVNLEEWKRAASKIGIKL